MPKYRLKLGKYTRSEETGTMLTMRDRDGREYKLPETQFVTYDARDPKRNIVELDKQVAEHPDNALRFEPVGTQTISGDTQATAPLSTGMPGELAPGQFDPQAELRMAEDQTTTITTPTDSTAVADLGWQDAVMQIQSMTSVEDVRAAVDAEKARARPRSSVLDAGHARIKELGR